MVGKVDYSSVPTTLDLENNSNQKKYTVNHRPKGLLIPKSVCALMAIGALLLAVIVGLLVFFLIPNCGNAQPEALTENDESIYKNEALNADDVDERLPRNILPTHYRIQIIPYIYNLTTNGALTITINVVEETNTIIFHVKDIDIDKKSLKVKAAGSDTPLEINSQEHIEGEKYKVVLNENLIKNTTYTLELMFTGQLNHHLQGFYRSQYEDLANYTTKYLVSTQFSPTDARRAFPCFDEPFFKAKFSISLARPANMTSISNMPLEKAPDIFVDKKDWFWDHYKETPQMSTYLVAFVISDLQAYGSSDKLIKIWSRRNLIHETRYSAELAPKILHYLEDYFQIKFPLPKIDFVAIPDFGFAAMENWGLITFRESALLFNEQDSSIGDKRIIATYMAHELGHQWFGNLLTPKWWNDLWLKEGFATYLQYVGVSHAEPSWNIGEEFIISETKRAFELDGLESSRPISSNVKNNRQIRQAFDDLSYGKGACIIRMMQHVLGEETFKHGLISFLKRHQYENADRNDLFAALTEEAHNKKALNMDMNVKDIMENWTNQPGFPVITAIYDRPNRKLIISQKRFYFSGSKDDPSVWWVPLSLITDSNPDFTQTNPKIWLKNEPVINIDFNTTNWYILNVNATGYFIVNYDEDNWRYLSSNIMNLPPLTRAQLISDSMDLARANLLDYDIPLKMIAHMAVHDFQIMYVPTSMAFEKLSFLDDILSTTPAYGLFEEFHQIIFKNTYQTVDRDDDFDSTNYLKQSIRRAVLEWSCKYSGSECTIRARHLFRAWMEKNIRIPANMRSTVYCTAIREGTEAEWIFAYEEYLKTNSLSERNILLDALGCTNKRWLLSRYLNFLIQNNSSIRMQDAPRVFNSVAKNSLATGLAFDFIRANWDQLLQHYGEGFGIVSRMVKSLPRYMNTEYQLSELIRFKSNIKNNIGTASQAFDSSIEQVKGNVEWMKKNYDSIEKWFVDHKYNYNLL